MGYFLKPWKTTNKSNPALQPPCRCFIKCIQTLPGGAPFPILFCPTTDTDGGAFRYEPIDLRPGRSKRPGAGRKASEQGLVILLAKMFLRVFVLSSVFVVCFHVFLLILCDFVCFLCACYFCWVFLCLILGGGDRSWHRTTSTKLIDTCF